MFSVSKYDKLVHTVFLANADQPLQIWIFQVSIFYEHIYLDFTKEIIYIKPVVEHFQKANYVYCI